MTWFVGIDMSKFSHCVCIMDESGRKIKEIKISNDYEGFSKLSEMIQGADQVLMAMEKGHGTIVDFFRNRGVFLYSINPKIIKRFKETLWVSGSKDDWRDAEAIAHYLQNYHDRLRPLLTNSPAVEQIRDYCEVYNRLCETQVQLVNRLQYVLENYFPLYLNLFSSRVVEILYRMILKYPKCLDLQHASREELTAFLQENYYRNPKYIDRVYLRIKAYRQEIAPETEEALSFEACYLADALSRLSIQEKILISKMENILQTHELGEIFLSIPGAGVVIAGHLLALFGDNPERFHRASEAQSYFGTAPYLYQSGNYCKVMMRRACNKMGRRVFYQLAFSSLKPCHWSRNYYDELRKRGKRNAAAMRSVSNKWVKVVFSMWKNKTLYDPIRLEPHINHSLSKIA